ncbi:zinc finger BED domain-containing protein 1-like [Myzus persicae]|uniref:zinc finger BED domain-containing protein 1-like n=1 Tax=Myzus persicae TaxID=13164 RepID=UPI000B93667B|nr:zinc finger BED domain-containing protein 1-like [Myzus persicae]
MLLCYILSLAFYLSSQYVSFFSLRFGTPSENQVRAFHEAIVKMIAEDLQPLSIVENSGFRSMIQLLDSRYEIPSRRSLGRTIIPRIFSTVQSKVEALLNEARHVAITTDIWTSMNTDSYLTMTVHFLSQTQLKTLVLCTKKLDCNHTGANICEIMREELNKWNIFEKVVAVVTDGGANIKSAVRHMGLSHLPCTAHKLNLIVQKALELSDNEEIGPDDNTDESDLKKIFKKCRNIVGFFKRSEVGNRMLVEKQKQLGNETVLKLKQDVRTRWNSTFLMLERLIKLKEPLTIVMMTLKGAPTNLSSEEWNIIEDMIPLLRPFDKLTVELSAEHYPMISMVIPLIRGLQSSLASKNPNTQLGIFIKNRLMENTTKRFDSLEEQTLTPHFSRATLLDPRCKKVVFGLEVNAKEAETCLVSETAALISNVSNTEQTTHTSEVNLDTDGDNVWNFLYSRVSNVQSQTTSRSSATSLMRQYLSMPHQDLKCNVAEFWNDHKTVLAPLSDIALKYIIIPATSVPAERIFSKAGQILSARRNRLLPKNVDQLIFLNKNIM